MRSCGACNRCGHVKDSQVLLRKVHLACQLQQCCSGRQSIWVAVTEHCGGAAHMHSRCTSSFLTCSAFILHQNSQSSQPAQESRGMLLYAHITKAAVHVTSLHWHSIIRTRWCHAQAGAPAIKRTAIASPIGPVSERALRWRRGR